MNLSEPLDGITSAVESTVLRVLARADVGFSGREVHRLAHVGSTSSVHRALSGLVRVGLVDAEARPPSIIYRINRHHVLWPAVESALAARSAVFESIRAYCAKQLAEVDASVVVYGSVARRDSGLDSDIDLYVVYPQGINDEEAIDHSYALSQFVERLTGNHAQVVAGDREYFDRMVSQGDPLVMNVIADGIPIYGRPLVADRASRAS